MESVVIYIFLFSGHIEGDSAPILSDMVTRYVDPVPQALMLTAIVVGVCFNSLALSIIVKIYQEWGTVLVSEITSDSEREDV
jgi:multicomponent Na+:H+ antiporter subunit C